MPKPRGGSPAPEGSTAANNWRQRQSTEPLPNLSISSNPSPALRPIPPVPSAPAFDALLLTQTPGGPRRGRRASFGTPGLGNSTESPQALSLSSARLPWAERDAYLLEGAGPARQQRFVTLFRSRNTRVERQAPKWSAHSSIGAQLRRLIGGAFFIGRVHPSSLSVYLATYHFVPLMMVLLALTVNLLLHVIMGLAFPLVADSYAAFVDGAEGTGQGGSDGGNGEHYMTPIELGFMRYYAQLVLPHLKAMLTAGLAFGGSATVGYKLMTVVGDAAMDGCRLVQHQSSRVELLWYMLFNQLSHIVGHGVVAIAAFGLCLGAELLLVFVVCFTGRFGIDWSSRDRNMVYLSMTVVGVQVVYMAATIIRLWRSPAGVSEDSVAVWWSRSLPRAQRVGQAIIAVAAAVLALESGGMYGATCFAEGLLYLNLLHVLIASAARATLFCIRLYQSAVVVTTDPAARFAALIFALPLLIITIVNFVVLDSAAACLLQVPPLLLLVDALCQHTHEHREEIEAAEKRAVKAREAQRRRMHHPRGTSRRASTAESTESVGSSPMVAVVVARDVLRIGLRALFLSQTAAFVHEAHYQVRNAMRAFLRLMLTLFMTVTVLLGLWVSLQFAPANAATSTTRCEATGPGRIKVTSSVLEAHLHALPEPVADPDELVYEADASRYDRTRYEGICQRRWAADLHAADLAYYATITYLDYPSVDFTTMFDFFREHRKDGMDWELVDKEATLLEAERIASEKQRSGASAVDTPQVNHTLAKEWRLHIDRSVSATFHHFRSPSRRANVIAIRGTEPRFARDFLQNVLVFSEVFLFQVISLLVPGAGLLPESMVKDLIRIGSLMDVGVFEFDQRRKRHHYYHAVEAYVNAFTLLQRHKFRQEHPPNATDEKAEARHGAGGKEKIVLTGHSLGGVVAQIVGSRLRIPAVAFSAPGIALMERKFGIEQHAIDAYITNVVASNDFLATLGKLGGSVNHIQCEHQRAEVCHSSELQTIRLWTMCPQYRALVAVNGSYTLLPRAHDAFLQPILRLLGAPR
jgi:hypothetical protein